MISFIAASILLIVFSLSMNNLEDYPVWNGIFATAFWLCLAWAIHSFLVVVLWRGLLPKFTGNKIPSVLIQLCGGILGLIALCIIGYKVLEVPVGSLITTSSLFIAVIGFALRNMISDLFTGIALGIEQPFATGDWIQIPDGTVGMVMEMNWRSTRLLTKEEISIVVPNSELAISTFKNYSKPERFWRDEFDILLDQHVTAHQAERLLLSAVRQVPEIVALKKPSEVRIKAYTENGIIWQVRYWVPDYPQMPALRYEVQKSVLKNMHYAGLAIPAEQIRLSRQVTTTQDGSFQFLRAIRLFNELTDDEVRQLEHSMNESLIEGGMDVVVQGESGASLFIVKEGLLQVNICIENKQFLTVAHLVPGNFFGEMSLLTGAPRNATVTAQVDSVLLEVGKSDLEPILHARPEIVSTLGEIVSERQSRNEFKAEGLRTVEIDSDESLLRRIRSFFALTPETPVEK